MPNDAPIDIKKLIDSDRMYHALVRAGEDWADKRSAYQLLEKNSKSILADLTKGFMNDYADRSKTEAEMEALASTAYRQHLQSVCDALKAYLRSEVRYDSLKTLVELRRSEESTRRAELQLT